MRLLILLLLICQMAPAAIRRQRRSSRNHASGIATRKRTHINSLIAAPGTAELDWANLYSFTNHAWTMPTSLRVTPGQTGWWSATELGIAFDALANVDNGGRRVTQFGDTMTLTGTRAIDLGEFDIAVAPQATFFLHNGSGARLGALAIGRYDHAGHSLSGTVTWTSATHVSDSSPRTLADFGVGYGWKHGRWSPHVNVVWEVATAASPILSLFEGIECHLSDRVALEVSAQHVALHGGITDRQLLIGVNVGGIRVRKAH